MDYPVLVNPGKPFTHLHAEENQVWRKSDSPFKTASWLKIRKIKACQAR
jgi:hypothetical protein